MEKTLIQSVHVMCQQEMSHAMMLKDNAMIDTIKTCLKSDDSECIALALKSLLLLSAQSANCKKLKTVSLLSLLSDLQEHDDPNISYDAIQCTDQLTRSVNAASIQNENSCVAAPSNGASYNVSVPVQTYLNTVVLAVPSIGFSLDQAVAVERMILTQSGVVSVTACHVNNRATFYSTRHSSSNCQSVCSALASIGHPASVVHDGANSSGKGYPMMPGGSTTNSSSTATRGKTGSLAMALYQDVPVSSGLKERSLHLGNVNGGAGASILARKNQASAVVEPATVVSRLTSWFW